MINEERTLADFKHTSDMLSYGSEKRVWRICKYCGKEDDVVYKDYVRGYQRCNLCAGKGRVHSARGPFNIEYFYAIIESISDGSINELKTFAEFKYYSIDLSHGSDKKIRRICTGCSKEDIVAYKDYTRGYRKCKTCAHIGNILSEEHKKNISISNKGKIRSIETRKKISENSPARKGENSPMFGKTQSEETRQRSSATKQGIPYAEWSTYAKDNPYCVKFNETVKEHIREKYDRRCFLCGRLEEDNITYTGKQKKLSVHHVDMNKQQGCNGHEWKLVPLCLYCHNSKVPKTLQRYIEYILENEV